MPTKIQGKTYYSAAEICRKMGVTRQTLWRWRRERKVPIGRRYRGHRVVFTRKEVAAIREYAVRLEPALPRPARQVKAFKPNWIKESDG